MKTIVADNLFDSERGAIVNGMAVLIEDSQIVSVERDAGLPATASLDRVEFSDCTVLPGLIDCHVHLAMDGGSGPDRLTPRSPAEVAVRGMVGARATLRGGVTTVRCVGTPANVDLVLRDAVQNGHLDGPHIVAAGRPISITGGHAHTMSIEADGPTAMAAAVRTQVKAGVDVIKLMVTGGVLTPGIRPGTPQMTAEELAAAITTAHRAGRKVCGHAEGADGVDAAVEAGIDSIEHGFLEAGSPTLDRMLRQHTYLVPTMIAYEAILESSETLPREAIQNAESAITTNQATFRRAVDAGVSIAMGSDAGTPSNPHGANWKEIELMVREGMSPSAALQSATAMAAALLGLPDRGVLRTDTVADLVVVAGNPVAEIAALASVRAVWARGKRVQLNEGQSA